MLMPLPDFLPSPAGGTARQQTISKPTQLAAFQTFWSNHRSLFTRFLPVCGDMKDGSSFFFFFIYISMISFFI